MMDRHVKVWDLVVSVGGAFGHRRIDTVLGCEVREGSVSGYRLAHDHVAPGSGETIRADTDFHAMKMHRPVVTALHVVFARPDKLDWRAAQTFRDRRRFALHVRVSNRASTKTATRHLCVKRYTLWLES